MTQFASNSVFPECYADKDLVIRSTQMLGALRSISAFGSDQQMLQVAI